MCEANGSMDSILQWGLAAQLDPRQKRAFESIISSFLLTFHDFQQDDYNDSSLAPESCRHARRTKDQLLFLKGGEGTQLIMMLHGMGGSGKSTVIALVMAYAQDPRVLQKSPTPIHNPNHCCDGFVRRRCYAYPWWNYTYGNGA